ncbi:hypothetical protein [Actinomyces succiniciruminis]|uniref:Uncharacterized protein n=1 Tax=Actinomyces succiniciruminis TaxID=1522002 RepID=A0A1L7RBX1_9ACTO|nr:hypothetical protein [Actinomyces succiniciruminis]CED91405.1 Hypothetical protein AAM4_1573 [Actinomyces succiniciruminis]
MSETGRWSWPVWARRLVGLTPTESLIVGELARLADWRGVAVTSTAHLQASSGRSRRAVFGALAGLERAGVLARERRRWDGHQAATWYRLQVVSQAVSPELTDPVADETEAAGSTTVSASESLGQGDVIDRQDNRRLRETIIAAVNERWRGPASDLLGATLEATASVQFAASIRRKVRFGGLSREEARVDVLSTAWELLREHALAIAGADVPWAKLTAIVSTATLSDGGQLPDGVSVGAADPADLDMVAADAALGQAVPVGAPNARADTQQVGYDDFGPALLGLVESLLDAGMDETTAWAGTLRIAELSTRSPSRRHTLAGEDPRLAELDVTPEAARAWMTMLVGSRRGAAASVVMLDADERAARARAVVQALGRQAA